MKRNYFSWLFFSSRLFIFFFISIYSSDGYQNCDRNGECEWLLSMQKGSTTHTCWNCFRKYSDTIRLCGRWEKRTQLFTRQTISRIKNKLSNVIISENKHIGSYWNDRDNQIARHSGAHLVFSGPVRICAVSPFELRSICFAQTGPHSVELVEVKFRGSTDRGEKREKQVNAGEVIKDRNVFVFAAAECERTWARQTLSVRRHPKSFDGRSCGDHCTSTHRPEAGVDPAKADRTIRIASEARRCCASVQASTFIRQ